MCDRFANFMDTTLTPGVLHYGRRKIDVRKLAAWSPSVLRAADERVNEGLHRLEQKGGPPIEPRPGRQQVRASDEETMDARARFADDWWSALDAPDKLAAALAFRDLCTGRYKLDESEDEQRARWADEVWRSISAQSRFSLAYTSNTRKR